MNTLTARCPGSKSMTQRALIIAALADGPSRVRGALDCDDSRRLASILKAIGADVKWHGDEVTITPGPLRSTGTTLDCDNGASTLRFASCLSLVTSGTLVLDGDARMRERPIGAMVDGLKQLGISAQYLGNPPHPPVALTRTDRVGSEARLDLSGSSQHATGLMLVAPCLTHGLALSWTDAAVSRPYLDMTVEMMRRMGAHVSWQGRSRLRISATGYRAGTLDIEPDWSTAAFLIAAGHLLGVHVNIPGALDHTRSLQGDSVFLEYAQELERPFARRFDLTDSPDLIAPIAALALFSSKPTAIRGVEHVRSKESDRIRVLSSQLSKLGARVVEQDDGIDIHPLESPPTEPVELDPSGDHRMAMAFALIGLRVPCVRVLDPRCVSKSFPSFWEELEELVAHSPPRPRLESTVES